MRKTHHTRLNKTAFELHYGREPITEISNLLNLDLLKKKITEPCISAEPDTLQVYSFNGDGGVSDQLPMEQKEGSKGVSNYPFPFYEKKIVKPKFSGAYSDKIQIAESCTDHTLTTADNRVLYRKHISKPISELAQEPNNRGTGLHGPDGRFIKSPENTTSKKRTATHTTGLYGNLNHQHTRRCQTNNYLQKD